MKVLLIGSGGREHALAWKISQSPLLKELHVAPGNAGISEIAQCHDIQVEDTAALLKLAQSENIDLTIVGPEAPLAAGIVDLFQKEGLKIFGPSQQASQIESSKVFSKHKMEAYGIPTASFEVFSHINEAKHYVIEAEMPVVIKADGLAQGKGVKICENSHEAVTALTEMMSEGIFGDAGRKVIVEEMLQGSELSILALSDGNKIIPLASSQDHKRAYDHDKGPNTGGMGAYSPCPLVSDEELAALVEKAVTPMIQGLARDGIPYRGLLYAGLMLTKNGPIVLEYNCRFGDPETQAVLPRLKSDLLPVFHEIASGSLTTESLEWTEEACVAVVMASGGYPGFYHKDFEIRGLEQIKATDKAVVFHAGTKHGEKGECRTAGGRVLALSVLGSSLKEAIEKVYAIIPGIQFDECFYRKDIGRKALEVMR